MSTKKISGISLMVCMALLPFIVSAQNDPQLLVLTRVHLNRDTQFTLDEWKAQEKEYFDKVTAKNDLIVGAVVLVHYFTSDNSEILFATVYRTWDDIEKAGTRNEELAKAAWPDEAQRKAFFDKLTSFYTTEHSDEILSILPNTKPLPPTAPESIFLVQTRHRAYPSDGKESEFTELANEYNMNVTLKNSLVKGYYPSRHLWGADSRDYIEAFAFASMSDMEKSIDEDERLEKAHWPDEAKRKEFFAKFNKYFEAWHSDALYRDVPELRK